MRRMRRTERSRGFTLIEVLLVAGILALLAAFAVPRLFSTANQAKVKLAEAAVEGNGPIGKALGSYKWDMGRFPETDEGLAALFETKEKHKDNQKFNGPYLEGPFQKLKDPWENPYEYRCPGEFNEDGYDLWSRGQDGVDDGGKEGSDDIKNWVEK